LLFLASLGAYAFPILLLGVPLYAYLKGVAVYDTFVEGAEEGLRLVLSVMPFMIAIFVGISCFRGSGGLDLLSKAMGVFLEPLGIPVDMLSLIIVRPISGSGALAITGDLLHTYGPDSPMGILASILQGATDTTFYVVTLYFGSVGIKKTSRAITACLMSDLMGFVAAFLVWRILMR
jgi:spore maturation protein B